MFRIKQMSLSSEYRSRSVWLQKESDRVACVWNPELSFRVLVLTRVTCFHFSCIVTNFIIVYLWRILLIYINSWQTLRVRHSASSDQKLVVLSVLFVVL